MVFWGVVVFGGWDICVFLWVYELRVGFPKNKNRIQEIFFFFIFTVFRRQCCPYLNNPFVLSPQKVVCVSLGLCAGSREEISPE